MHFVLRFYTFFNDFPRFCILPCDFTHFQWFYALLNFVLRFYSFFSHFPRFCILFWDFIYFPWIFHNFLHFRANSHTFLIISAVSHIPQWFCVFSKFLWWFYTFSNYFVFFIFYNFFFITLNLLNTSTWINFILTQLNFTRKLVYRSGSQILTLIRKNLWNRAPIISVKSHNHPVPSHLLYGSFQLFLQLKPFFHNCWLS